MHNAGGIPGHFGGGATQPVAGSANTACIPGRMENKISDPRLVLKATAPKASRSLIYRSRLGLHQGSQADSPVICVQAAAGYGKSSLLLQWRREALESGALVAWLTLDEHDDGTSFIGGLNAALSIGSGTGRFAYKPPESDTLSLAKFYFFNSIRQLALAAFIGQYYPRTA